MILEMCWSDEPASASSISIFFHGLLGLSGHIADADPLRSLEVLADPPMHEDHRALRHNHPANVVVELLFGVGVLGIELPDTLVRHLGLPSDQASELSDSRPVLSVGMRKFNELVSVLSERMRVT
jgi:hypothetical protein